MLVNIHLTVQDLNNRSKYSLVEDRILRSSLKTGPVTYGWMLIVLTTHMQRSNTAVKKSAAETEMPAVIDHLVQAVNTMIGSVNSDVETVR